MSRERDMAHERLVRAAAVSDPISAEVLRDALARAGIRSLTKNVDALNAYSGGGVTSLEIYVLEGDAEAAAAIVAAEPLIPDFPLSRTAAHSADRHRRRFRRRPGRLE